MLEAVATNRLGILVIPSLEKDILKATLKSFAFDLKNGETQSAEPACLEIFTTGLYCKLCGT